jgi:RimJ/RimL family protein N-acetyltransferase
MNYSDLELLHIQIDVLYVHDVDERLLRINESDTDHPAPCFSLSRSLAGNIWSIRHDLPDDLAAELAHLAAAEPVVDNLREQPYHLKKYKALLAPHASLKEIESGPAYYLPEFASPTTAVEITLDNKSLLEANFPYTASVFDERSPVFVIVQDHAAIAACYCARSSTAAAEAGVDTLEGYRGRGYAAEVVRGWAGAVRAMGKLPLYSTSWDNTPSQAVAAKLGAIQYGTNFSIT